MIALELVPRRAPDPRFAWRVAEIPAASHPTCRGGARVRRRARAGDRVWDPFCGSGAELDRTHAARRHRARCSAPISTTRRSPPRARNLAAANVTATLVVPTRARTLPGTVDLIITNPPLGSRVQIDAAALLVAALPNFARALAPGGRLVWITPATRKTSPVAEQLGLRRTRSLAVDLGGVRGHLERWER